SARGVGDEEPVSRYHHAVRTGGVVVAGEAGEISFDLFDKNVAFGVDDVDALVRTIGEVVELRVRIDPTDVERNETRYRNGREQPDGVAIMFIGQRDTGTEHANKRYRNCCSNELHTDGGDRG